MGQVPGQLEYLNIIFIRDKNEIDSSFIWEGVEGIAGAQKDGNPD